MDEELTYWRDYSKDKKLEWQRHLEEEQVKLERLRVRGMQVEDEAQHAAARVSKRAMRETRDLHQAKYTAWAKRRDETKVQNEELKKQIEEMEAKKAKLQAIPRA